MTESGRAGARALRGAGLAVVTVTLALLAHLVGGGTRPAATTLLQAIAVMAAVLAVLTPLPGGRPRSMSALVACLGGCQLLLHQWFALQTPGTCAGHLVGSVLPWNVLAQTARACATTGDATTTMLTVAVAAHAMAALLTGALLTRGEALVACAVALVLPALPTLTPVRSTTARDTSALARALTGTLARGQVDRRGPPALARAF